MGSSLFAQGETGWRAGVAEVSITPSGSIWMAGYDARTKPSEGVLHDIRAKALALQHGGGEVWVLVTVDLVGVTPTMTGAIAGRAAKLVPRDRILFNASHTHSGPVAGEEWLARYQYRMSGDQPSVVRAYTAFLYDRTAGVIEAAVGKLAPAALDFGLGVAGIAVNRRRVGAPDRPGPVDQDVPVLRVRGAAGNTVAIVFGYACHATSLGIYQISGDYPGFAQLALEKHHPGAVAMYVAGCGADINPLPRRTVELAGMYGEILAAAVDQVLAGKMRPLRGPLAGALETVDVLFQAPPTRDQLEAGRSHPNAAQRRSAERLLAILDRDGKISDRYPFPVQVWRFGPELALIALAGEVVVDYSLRLKNRYGWDTTWVAGYSNDVFAYIPSLRVLKEGGYEGGEAMINRPLAGPFRTSVEEIIVEKVGDLMSRTGSR